MQKTLIIGPAWIGDMVMAQALFKLMKQEQPDTVIDVLAPKWTHPLLARMPEVNQSFVAPFCHGEHRYRQRYDIAVQMRKEHYEQAIVLPSSFKAALVPFLAKIPKRTGWRGEMRWGLLNDIRHLNKKQMPLMIQRFLALGLPKGADLPTDPMLPSLVSTPEAVSDAMLKQGITKPQAPVLALCPGAEFGPAKRWPAEYYAEVAKKKLAEGWEVWIFGSGKDQPVAHEIQQQCNEACLDLTGKTTLAEAIDLMSSVTQVLTNDSGLMHIAAALDIPAVVVYGSSSKEFTPPLTKKVKTLSLELECSPCFKRECPLGHFRCMKDMHPQQVLSALQELPS